MKLFSFVATLLVTMALATLAPTTIAAQKSGVGSVLKFKKSSPAPSGVTFTALGGAQRYSPGPGVSGAPLLGLGAQGKFAKHFGWTPEQVSQLTPGQVAVYLAGIGKLLQLDHGHATANGGPSQP